MMDVKYAWRCYRVEINNPSWSCRWYAFKFLIWAALVVLFAPSDGWTKDGSPVDVEWGNDQ